MRSLRSLPVALVACLTSCFQQNPVGELDTSFNNKGFVTHHNTAGGNLHEFGRGIVGDSQGRIVVAGTSKGASGFDMVVWRYTPAGGHDWSFGPPSSSPSGGFVVHHGAAGGNSDDSASGVLVDGVGRILVCGSSMNAAGNFDMVVWGFLPTGASDFQFGDEDPNTPPGSLQADGLGFLVRNNAAGGNKDDRGNAIALDKNNNILVTGYSRGSNGADAMVVWRFTASGKPDFTFGPNQQGSVVVPSPVGGSASGNAVAVDASGNILVCGARSGANGNVDMTLWRFKPSGSPDTSFGSGGSVSHNGAAGGNGIDIGRALAIDAAGRLVVAGESRNAQGNPDMAVWRFKPDGSLDTTLAGKGFFVHNGAAGGNSHDNATSVVLDKQNRILAAGSSRKSATGNFDMAIWCLTPDGQLDKAFGPPGKGFVVHGGAAGGTSGDDFANAMVLDSQDRIVVAGESFSAANFDMAVWRYK